MTTDTSSINSSTSVVDERKNELREKVIKYVQCDDLIKVKQSELKELKEHKKECEEFILKYLDETNNTHINLDNGKLFRNKTSSVASLKINEIEEIIQSTLNVATLNDTPETKAEVVRLVISTIEESRAKVEKVYLKRSKTKE